MNKIKVMNKNESPTPRPTANFTLSESIVEDAA